MIVTFQMSEYESRDARRRRLNRERQSRHRRNQKQNELFVSLTFEDSLQVKIVAGRKSRKQELEDSGSFVMGTLDQICSHCNAFFYNREQNDSGIHTRCCLEGAINLPHSFRIHSELKNIIENKENEFHA